MIFVVIILFVMLFVIGAVAVVLMLRDSESWLMRRFTGKPPARVDEEELEVLAHDRAGDT